MKLKTVPPVIVAQTLMPLGGKKTFEDFLVKPEYADFAGAGQRDSHSIDVRVLGWVIDPARITRGDEAGSMTQPTG